MPLYPDSSAPATTLIKKKHTHTLCLINSKIQSKYHRNGCKLDTPHTYIHDPLLSRLGTDTSIKK